MLTPSSGFCWTPSTNVGSGSPAASRTVGATSITCANCERISPLALIPRRPVDDRPVAGAAPVGCDLLRPLVRRAHRVRPADRVVVVRVRAAEVVQPLDHELGRLERCGAVEVDHLVVGAVQRALGGGAVVADDVVDERVLEDAEFLDGVEQPAHVVVGELEEAGVDLHLAPKDRLQVLRHLVPGGDLLVAGRQLGVRWDHAELLLLGERPLAQRVPAVVERALVLVGPLRSDVVRCVRRAGREVREEGLVRHERLLLADPLDRLVRHVGHEVVALFRRLLGLDRDRALVDRRVVLMGLPADEAVEVLEAAPGRPVVEGPHRARLPHRHLVALAELRRRVAVQLQRLRERRAGVRPDRVVARCRRRDLRDAAHADRVVVAAAQQRRAGGRAERSGVEAVVLQPLGGEPFGVRRVDRTTEGTRGSEPDVVDQDDQDVGSSLRRPQRLDRRKRVSGSFAS